MMPPSVVHVSKHPLVLHKITLLRDETTEPKQFRELVRELAQLLFVEATRELLVRHVPVRTPLAKCPGHQIAEVIGLVPILRAGLGMTEAILELAPFARVWHLGLYRDHQTLKPVTYYTKLDAGHKPDLAVVVDPMLATGGSAVAAVNLLKQWGVKRIQFLGLIAAPDGLKVLQEAHPDVDIYLGALDSHLNEKSYIVPGLGDAGDRQFGTG
jgi:uracil phosphoribosyltransferase